MHKNLLEAQDIFLDRVNQICNKFGLNNIMAQLYAILYLSNKPLSLNDMLERLKISKGSVSTNIRALERYGAVRRVWVKGSRRDYYEAEMDISKVIVERVRAIIQNRLSEVGGMIDATCQALNSVSLSVAQGQDDNICEALKLLQQRMDALKSLYYQAKSILDLFDLGLLRNVLTEKAKSNNNKEVLV